MVREAEIGGRCFGIYKIYLENLEVSGVMTIRHAKLNDSSQIMPKSTNHAGRVRKYPNPPFDMMPIPKKAPSSRTTIPR